MARIAALIQGLALLASFPSCLSAQSVDSALLSAQQSEKNAAVRKYTTISISDASQSSKYSSDLYKHFVGQVILNPALRAVVPEEDLALLDNLPGHTDRTFLQLEQAELRNVCDGRARPGLDIADVALDFEKAKALREERMLSHYEKLMSSLSAETVKLIESLIFSAPDSIQITQVQIDMFGLASEFPDIASVVMTDGCERFERQVRTRVLQDVTLKDELTSNVQYQEMELKP